MRPLHAIAVCCGFAVLVSLISLCQSAEPSHFVADANNKVSANLPSRPMDSKQQSLCQSAEPFPIADVIPSISLCQSAEPFPIVDVIPTISLCYLSSELFPIVIENLTTSLCPSAEPSLIVDENQIIRLCPSTNPSKSPQTIMTIPKPIMTALQMIIIIFTASSQSSLQWWFIKTMTPFSHCAAEIRRVHSIRPAPKPDWWLDSTPDCRQDSIIVNSSTPYHRNDLRQIITPDMKLQWWLMQALQQCAAEFHVVDSVRPPPKPDWLIFVRSLRGMHIGLDFGCGQSCLFFQFVLE